ncbi:alpha/beta hydrolase domain-containing protein [Frigidibacter sp. MR17.24]|uniref:alpha/beta hydrolase domain-containing protein n=1 Tax=Frigidibacter sp. MR17.24 TaxID=3127345 RepID=UPI003012FACB
MIALDIATQAEFAGGRTFGSAGRYTASEGRVRLAIRPEQIGADGIWTPERIATDPAGLIRAECDATLLVPDTGNGTLLVEFVNRGRTRLLSTYCDAPEANRPVTADQAGNGWLMEQGYTLLSLAWQGDLLPGAGRLTARLPGFTDDRPTRIATEYVVNDPGHTCLPLSGDIIVRSYPATSTDPARARLTRRRWPESPREPLDGWAFERVETSAAGRFGPPAKIAVTPSAEHLHLPAGFEPGWIYELDYEATGALAFDIGFVAIAETVAFLRHGGAGNPLAGRIARTIGIGQSQSGRALREFLWRGFNRDSAGRAVFDGILPHVAGAGRIAMNRYANLNIPSSRDYEDHAHPSDLFPFAYAASTDHLSGRRDAILKRPGIDPKVIHSQTSAEYWHRRGSLVHTDTQGNDLPEPEGLRCYLFAGAHHVPPNPPVRPVRGYCQQLGNTVYVAPLEQGLLQIMQDWLTGVALPPPSRVPTRAAATLVSPEECLARFPAPEGTALPRHDNRLEAIDYGTAFAAGGAAAADARPDPARRYVTLVPACDATGNDLGGIRPPMLDAPLGSYTGWNLRSAEQGGVRLFSFAGGYIPFAVTKAEAAAQADPRPAILSLFPTPERYAQAIGTAARALLAERFILPQGVDAFLRHAAGWGRVNHVHGLSEPGAD